MRLNKTLTALVAVTSLGLSAQASAAFTQAGETISNSVSISYTAAGTPTTDTQTSDFKVDRKVDMSLELNTSVINKTDLAFVAGDTLVTMKYTLTNSGNKDQDFIISLADTAATSVTDTPDTYADDATFTPDLNNNYEIYDADPTGGGETAISTAVVNVTAITNKSLPAATDTKEIWIQVIIPTTGFIDEAIAVLEAIATASTGTAALTADDAVEKNDSANIETELVVFADGLDADEATGASNGKASKYVAIQFQVGGLTDPDTGEGPGDPGYTGPLLTAIIVNDPICDDGDPATAVALITSTPDISTAVTGCNDTSYYPKAIPGAVIEFTFSVTNSGSGAVPDLEITETLTDEYQVDSLAYVADSATINGTADGGVNVVLSAVTTDNKITVTFSPLPGGDKAEVKYRAILN